MATQQRVHGFQSRGQRQKSSSGEDSKALHWPRTLAAKRSAPLAAGHLRFKPKSARTGVLHCFVLDCSGSMLSGQQLALAQGALRQLHQRAYQQRAYFAFVTYAGDGAQIVVHPTAARPFNALRAEHALPRVQGGGATPLMLGIAKADALLADNRRRHPSQQQWLWLLSDGRVTDFPARPYHADVVQIVDCESQPVALHRCRTLAEQWQADYQTLNDLLI